MSEETAAEAVAAVAAAAREALCSRQAADLVLFVLRFGLCIDEARLLLLGRARLRLLLLNLFLVGVTAPYRSNVALCIDGAALGASAHHFARYHASSVTTPTPCTV